MVMARLPRPIATEGSEGIWLALLGQEGVEKRMRSGFGIQWFVEMRIALFAGVENSLDV
ncbi:hypothetical protein GCM10007160_25800 [Litchfieldella qijiaojingensis]|uniref:Uncharacterized protein n=1 Tax=Litchfieldella qijiaojingensis TaxID=980347 RepID=A0ABQ2YZH7_9GAMM|nr:hypothetical protein GCM10007160_25800 [Halomonas qijiaojingensis]